MTKEAYEELCGKTCELIRKHHGMIRTKDILGGGVSYKQILSMVEDGTIRRVKNGYYTTAEDSFSEEEVIVSLFGDGVLTMQSALFYHGYLKEKPTSWHIAISKNTSKSRFKDAAFSLVPYYTEERVLPIGAEEFALADGKMKIYGIDRLICDVLKYEEKLERDDYKTAIRAYIADDGKDVARLLSYAKERKVLSKVQNVIGVWL